MGDRDLIMARRIAEAAAAEGGRAYFVGGFVRDRLMGRENKDIDIEVHSVSVETLTRILGFFDFLKHVCTSFIVSTSFSISAQRLSKRL